MRIFLPNVTNILLYIVHDKRREKYFIIISFSTDGAQLTWNEPLPVLSVQESDSHQEVHINYTMLIEGSINASLSWYFSLSSGLTLLGVNLKLKTDNIAFVNNQKQEVSAGFKDKYAISWIPNQRITLVIFKVTSEHNATFACEVVASGNAISAWRSQVQVVVVGRVLCTCNADCSYYCCTPLCDTVVFL